ncbi:MAG: amino acid ABC transporter permease [Pseudomonadota bacterium]
MSFLKRVRPSNLIILAALPFIIYLFASSANYQRSLRAIVGIEDGSGAFVPGFLLLSLAFTSGLAVLVFSREAARWPQLALLSAVVNFGAATVILFSEIVHPFAISVVANGVDPFTSDLVVRGVTPRQLTEGAEELVGKVEAILNWIYFFATVLGLAMVVSGRFILKNIRLGKGGFWILLLTNGFGFSFLFFYAHIAFAAGVATTIRAAIIAYLLAAVLGLVWVGLLQLHYTKRTTAFFSVATVLLIAASAWFLTQPKDTYVLTGTLDGRVAVIAGTPSSVIGAVRYGEFPGAPEKEVSLRTYRDADLALGAIEKGPGVSAAMIPQVDVPDGWPVIWSTEALNDRDRSAGVTLVVLSIVLGLLTFGGFLHKRHPLAIGSEFVVDTIRGIPMLVIVLYVGLPLSGALKDATQGVLDPPNLVRGIFAMGLAYSAYLAEIFRSGINAIPTGQIEAAYSIGLNRWQTARLVILPQAFRIIIPPLGNELIAILKDTSLLSILSIRDITQRMREFQAASFLPFAPYNSAAIFYIFLTLAAASLINTIERKYDIKHR